MNTAYLQVKYSTLNLKCSFFSKIKLFSGIILQPGILALLWDIMLKTQFQLRYLSIVCINALERPDLNFDVMPRFWETISKILSHTKPSQSSQLLNLMAKTFLTLDSQQLASKKDTLQALANFCTTG